VCQLFVETQAPLSEVAVQAATFFNSVRY
jgi:hypothetical protein